jgi:hypothetical protein
VNGNDNGKEKRANCSSMAAAVWELSCWCGVLYPFASGGTKIDPSEMTRVEKRDLARSVVATGKIEPITKVEIKSKEEHKNALQSPEGSIIYDKDKKASVEIPDPKGKEGKRKVAVNIGISHGAKTELLGGLKERDQVVLR